MRRRNAVGFSLLKTIQDVVNMLGRKAPYLGIDLGSEYVRLYLAERGVVLREKNYVVQNIKTRDFVVFGDEAYDMLGKTPPNLKVFAPISQGRVSDFDAVVFLLKKVIDRAVSPYRQRILFGGFYALFSVPLGLTEVEEMALVEAGKKVGAKEVYLVETPLSGGFGLHLPVMENTGTMLVDVGGGTTEVAVLSLGGVVLYKLLKIGGRDFNNALINYLRLRYGLLVGEKTAEEIKLSLGSAFGGDSRVLDIAGRSVETGMPKSLNIKAQLLYEALYPYFGQIKEAIKEAIEETPPELLKDISQKGIILSGMSAHFPDLEQFLKKELGFSIALEKEPGLAVVRGLGWLIEHPGIMHKIAVKLNSK